MMTPNEHAAEAERLLAAAKQTSDNVARAVTDRLIGLDLAERYRRLFISPAVEIAAVHAQLARRVEPVTIEPVTIYAETIKP